MADNVRRLYEALEKREEYRGLDPSTLEQKQNNLVNRNPTGSAQGGDLVNRNPSGSIQGSNLVNTNPQSGYTWDQFEQAARQAGLYDKFSDADLGLARSNPNAGMSILSAKQQWVGAKTDEARALANARAEAIRSSYGGYTGGSSGGYYNLNPLSPIQYQDSEREQQTRQRMEAAYQKTQAPYDPTTDPAYIAYRKQYLREGQRATQDTMATAAAMTGGRPSSYAVTAAAQQGNYYAAQLTDKIPQLYKEAYDRAMQEYQQQANQYNQDRAFGYGKLTDEVQNQRILRSEELQARQTALERAYQAYQVGDSSQLEALGIDTSKDVNRQIQQLQAQMQEKQIEQQTLQIEQQTLQIEQTKQAMKTQEWQDQFQQAQAAANYGDYSLLSAMGFDVTRADFQNQLAVAQLIAQYTGDVSGLYALMRSGSVNAGGGAGTEAETYTGTSGGSGGYSGSSGGSGRYYGGSGSSGGGSSSGSKSTTTLRQETKEQAHGYDSRGYPSTTGSYGSATGSGKTGSSSGSSGDWWNKW